MWTILLLIIQTVVASTVTVQIIGERFISTHQSGAAIYVADATPITVKICLVFGWQNLTMFRHTDKCAAVSTDCRCYHWVNTKSGNDCVIIALVGGTEVNVGYRLLQRQNVQVLSTSAIIQYGILSRRWQDYQFEDFAAAVCGHANFGIVPGILQIFHTIKVIRITERTSIPDPSDIDTLAIFVYCFVVLIMFWYHTNGSNKQSI